MANERELYLGQQNQPRTLAMGIEEGNQGAQSVLGSRLAQSGAQAGQDLSPYKIFGQMIMDLLKKQQQLGTGQFREAELKGQEEQARRILAPATPGMSPQLQGQIRQAEAGAVEPQIAGARQMRQTFAEQISAFGDTITQANVLANLMQEDEQSKRKEKIDLLMKFPETIKNLPDDVKKQYAKEIGVSDEFLANIKSDEEKWETTTLSDGSLAQKNTKTGEIKVLVKAEKAVGKQLPPTQVVMLSDAAFLPGVLSDLESLITENSYLFGAGGKIKGFLSRTRLGTVEDDLRRAAQLVGKFMEGGVLRKEDEVKYAKMLPNLDDWNSEVALDKLNGVKQMLEKKYGGYISNFRNSGYDTSGLEINPFGTSGTSSLREQVITAGYDYDVMSQQYTDEEIKEALGL